MDSVAGFPFYPLEITKDGTVFREEQKAALLAAVGASGAERLTDLFVVSHGWNNDMADARTLYEDLFKSVGRLLTGPRAAAAADRRFVVVGVFWPSKKF